MHYYSCVCVCVTYVCVSVLYVWCGVMRAETGGQYCIMSSFHLWDSFQGSVRPLGLRALSLPYLLD